MLNTSSQRKIYRYRAVKNDVRSNCAVRKEKCAPSHRKRDASTVKRQERKSVKMQPLVLPFLLLSLTVRHKRNATNIYWRVIYRAIKAAVRLQPQCQTRISNVGEIVREYVPAHVTNIAPPVPITKIDHIISS